MGPHVRRLNLANAEFVVERHPTSAHINWGANITHLEIVTQQILRSERARSYPMVSTPAGGRDDGAPKRTRESDETLEVRGTLTGTDARIVRRDQRPRVGVETKRPCESGVLESTTGSMTTPSEQVGASDGKAAPEAHPPPPRHRDPFDAFVESMERRAEHKEDEALDDDDAWGVVNGLNDTHVALQLLRQRFPQVVWTVAWDQNATEALSLLCKVVETLSPRTAFNRCSV